MRSKQLTSGLLYLPTPLNISIWWSFGSLLGLFLVIQIFSGFILSMHYSPDMYGTFDSVVHIMREDNSGWLIRYVHANGASMFFVFLYLHLGRGLYYQSYLLQPHTWLVGVSIFLLSMATAFLGYVLPWGQMSFWGATVITNLMSTIPWVGGLVVEWLWGGFTVSQPTLNRFYSLHFLLPFVISIFVMLHLIYLHKKGSSNPLGNLSATTKLSFHPYFTIKDIVGFSVALLLFFVTVNWMPTLLSDPENYMNANPNVTPAHIQPEWYFLFAYAILRSIPSKLGGVLALAFSVFILYFLPLGASMKKMSTSFNPFMQLCFWIFIVTFIFLTWLGACAIEPPFILLSKIFMLLYFFSFLVMLL
uniref:Cytochrome b n=1 Tax=Meghimatium bilineatum TaxID=318265 RepID=A0A344AYZ8_9EUPU|nr:cytochrome b [Meghimatium bilineatum]UZH97779.1 cytochrome b [Meghimatium bilineatum]